MAMLAVLVEGIRWHSAPESALLASEGIITQSKSIPAVWYAIMYVKKVGVNKIGALII
ncbi:MAG: hypothetical protein K5868_08230 [Lachnospiraceae bacterium]|nr:hypothetical protein [Lachnospiraceae bacterium]